MIIHVKVLNKQFYSEESDGMLLNQLPLYQTSGSAGLDLVSTESFVIYPNERRMVGTGLAICIAADVMGMIVPRSGLGTKGLVLANTVGIIDSDFRGEIKMSLLNNGYDLIPINAGDRIAQLIFVPIIKAQWVLVDDFVGSVERNTEGFGSTGV